LKLTEDSSMRKLVFGLSATILAASAAFAADPTVSEDTRMAAADTAAFNKLDADGDGRVSAIEAANDSKIAAAFTQADVDKDGYLTKSEFANMARMKTPNDSTGASPRSETTTPDEDASYTVPPQ
jgi:Ca2+-binding EF-hand superfamily protein